MSAVLRELPSAIQAVGIAALTLLLFGEAPASAQPYATIVSFGDSLSDTGNNPPTGDYFDGRWSNGLLWNEYLAADFGASLTNMAFAGSETSDLARQAELARGISVHSNTTLFTVWSGANDFIDHAAYGMNSSAWDQLVAQAASNISFALHTLYTNGARHFVVVNLPDLSQTPAALGLPGVFQKFIRNKVVLFNTRLAAVLEAFRKSRPQVQLTSVDAFALLDLVVADPSAYGFSNVTGNALAEFVNPSFDGPAADFLFWDQIHPTTKAHELFSQWATNALAATPPVIIEEPVSEQVVAGSNAVFAIQASGATSYQWRFRGRPIAGATDQIYSIVSARPANSGKYSVLVRNDFGEETTSNAVLTVIVPPKILKQPASTTTALAGRTARFRVLAAGSAPLRYQWQFNAGPLMGATNAVLSLPDVQTNQAGAYSVIVTNAGGSAVSSNAVLTVEE